MRCVRCNHKLKEQAKKGKEQGLCVPCFHESFCTYCEPPVEHANCPGHEINREKGNRFMKDEEFVEGMQFEFESDNHVRKNIRGL